MTDKTLALFQCIQQRNQMINHLKAERNNLELKAIKEGGYEDWVGFNHDYIEWERTQNS